MAILNSVLRYSVEVRYRYTEFGDSVYRYRIRYRYTEFGKSVCRYRIRYRYNRVINLNYAQQTIMQIMAD